MKPSSTTVASPCELDHLEIDLSDNLEVSYWTSKLGIEREELFRAVQAVGVRLAPVVSLLLAEGAPHARP